MFPRDVFDFYCQSVTITGGAHEISADELLPRLNEMTSLVLVDVREPDEFTEWKIPGSINLPLGQLADRLDEVSRTGQVVTICAAGLRAHKGAEILLSAGFDVLVLDGGMAAWGRVSEMVKVDFGDVAVCQFRRRGKGCLSYVVGSHGNAVVIDPSSNIDQYLTIAKDRAWNISHVLDTHLHADHLSGARHLAEVTGATLLLNPADHFSYAFTPIVDGLRIELSSDMHFVVSAVSTPGHTEGSTVYQLGSVALFTGDTLFLESVGRPDLADQAEAFAHSLYRSLHDVVLPLPDDILIFPAHFGDSVDVRFGELVTRRLGDLRQSLPALALSEDDFVRWALARVVDRPPNYQEIVRFNAGRSDRSLSELETLELGPNRCAIAN